MTPHPDFKGLIILLSNSKFPPVLHLEKVSFGNAILGIYLQTPF